MGYFLLGVLVGAFVGANFGFLAFAVVQMAKDHESGLETRETINSSVEPQTRWRKAPFGRERS
jgi:hypothetical protein